MGWCTGLHWYKKITRRVTWERHAIPPTMYVLTNRRNTIVIFGNTLKLILFSRGSNTSETNFGAAICPYIHRCVYLLVVNVKRRHLINSMLNQMIFFEVLRMDICDVANEHILLNIYITNWSVFYQFRPNNKGNIKAPHYWKKMKNGIGSFCALLLCWNLFHVVTPSWIPIKAAITGTKTISMKYGDSYPNKSGPIARSMVFRCHAILRNSFDRSVAA